MRPRGPRTREEILAQLRSQLAVDQVVAARALGIGRQAMSNAIKRGVVPCIDLGPTSKKKPVPSAWVLAVLRLADDEEDSKEKAASQGGLSREGEEADGGSNSTRSSFGCDLQTADTKAGMSDR